ncbi:aminoacyl-tRNA hydrolase [Bartonella tamiae]|uniref:Peptidyl-tRNA hydrolase n=1 Tax=Bartonella tamiae Th239 TaxID=1094558 RepID=J0ZLB0_9HYPH|nr:aminoacyl-tRNA hydrolase [Bartonella tamiae]EJF89193.1 peptidyl-tRNA hydrolase [Bartonella tamiae Th239]EJF95404.1 peptidyl-tRNA hydrolase [Bartonella tamiae Th307]
MLLIVGLGNPGSQYQNNRHNIGFMAVDSIQQKSSFSPWTKKFHAEVSTGFIENEKIFLLKPQTFMNLSGQAVGEAMRFYKLQPENIIVFYDELDLIPGKMRIKVGGGSGGHNGIKSIDAHCGLNYKRVRLGIGHPGSKDKVTPYVLGDFSQADNQWRDPVLNAIATHISMLVQKDDNSFMNIVSRSINDNTTKLNKNSYAIQKASDLKEKSHIHQARQTKKLSKPVAGPMADMLKKLFSKDDT